MAPRCFVIILRCVRLLRIALDLQTWLFGVGLHPEAVKLTTITSTCPLCERELSESIGGGVFPAVGDTNKDWLDFHLQDMNVSIGVDSETFFKEMRWHNIPLAADNPKNHDRVEAKLHLKRASSTVLTSLVRRGIKRIQVLSLRRPLRDVIHHLTCLESLNLTGCYNLTDICLSQAFDCECPSIIELNLSMCKPITDACVTNAFQYLPNLEVLDLSGCSHDNHGHDIMVCREWRDAAYNKSVWRGVEAKLHLKRASSTVLTSLVRRGIKRIQVLSLRRPLRDVIHHLTCLESLNLTGCYNLTDICLSQAFDCECPSIIELNLSMCKPITDACVTNAFQYLPNLEVLDLSGCSHDNHAAPNMEYKRCSSCVPGLGALTGYYQLDQLSPGHDNHAYILNILKQGVMRKMPKNYMDCWRKPISTLRQQAKRVNIQPAVIKPCVLFYVTML
ncbi:FBXL14 [Cordylochernes scorpioides]|uniref:FBXL14 n=1 Tax=Cordylochernes scorpioides TaxID=51811 RepID=A0ABY6KC38_9ARAC|nr:FBXL14 [Cordylochernes scorpioides]